VSRRISRLQTVHRTADAHAVVAPVLEGFSPTPELPLIAEAPPLWIGLPEANEVKSAAVPAARRLKLQTSCGQALFWSEGLAAEETKAAFRRTQELAAGIADTAGGLPTYYGVWVGGLLRGELAFALRPRRPSWTTRSGKVARQR
jgi:hypothetical protein